MTIYVDIDNTICSQHTGAYEKSEPWHDNIRKINKLFDEGHYIKYWTGRGTVSQIDYYILTEEQLKEWGCKYHELSVGDKPDYDLLICDKTKRIEEI